MNINTFFDGVYHTLSQIEALKGHKYSANELDLIKDKLLIQLDDCLKIIKSTYEAGNLNELKNLQGQIEILGEKCEDEEIQQIFQAAFDEKQQAIDKKIDAVINELSQRILTLENQDSPFLDEYRLLRKGAPGDKKIDAVFQQWFLSQAVLCERTRQINLGTRCCLDRMILQAYRKTTGFVDAKSLRIQTTPLYPTQTGYYRHDQFQIGESCYDAYARDMGVMEKLYLIDSPLLREVFHREMPHPGLDVNIDSVEKFDALIDTLLNKFKEKKSIEYPVLVDLSTLIESQNRTPGEVAELVHEFEVLLEQKAKFFALKNGADVEAVKENLFTKIQFIAFVKHRDQDILILPKFFDQMCAYEEIDDMIGRSGFRLSPAQTIDAWLKVESPEQIFQKEHIPVATLATRGSFIPKVFESWGDFVNHPLLRKFEALSDMPGAPLYQKLLARATVNLLRGLSSCKIDQTYQEKKIDDLLQIAYYRMLNAMGEAILRREKFTKFYSQVELIHQEIQAMLTLAEPYGEHALAESVLHHLTGGVPVIPHGIDRPKVHLKASAMHGMASVIAGVEAQKGGAPLNVAVQKDSYYESTSLFEKSRTYQVSVLDGDRLQEDIETAFAKVPDKPIDLFICEFHHNISLTRQAYHPEDVLKQVKAMHQKGLLADKCTIVIDTTISLDQSDEVRKFLADPEILQMIQEGKLNIVLLHSAQKFDMLGFDNYYGGITTSINDHHSFNSFNARMDHPLDQLKGFNYQGLTHLQKYGDSDTYRKAIMENTRKLYAMIPKEIIYHDGMTTPMQISKNEDDQQVFLDVKFPNFPRTGFKVNRKLREFAEKRKLPLTSRASFGFVNTNLSSINNDIFRLNPGLDDEKNLAQYAEFFKIMQVAINKNMDVVSKLDPDKQDQALAAILDKVNVLPAPLVA